MSVEITKITTHSDDAKKRLLYQYKGKVKLESLIDSYYGAQIQDLENVLFQLLTRLDIDSSEGVQLDKIGGLVGQERNGLADSEYRIFIKATIGKNVSEGDASRLIDIYKIITSATLVHLDEYFPAAITLMSNNSLPDNLMALAIILLQDAVGAGIRLNYIGYWDDPGFAFAGDNTGGGWGDLNDPLIGGKFATMFPLRFPFAFAGLGDPDARGFGDIFNPYIGGVFS